MNNFKYILQNPKNIRERERTCFLQNIVFQNDREFGCFLSHILQLKISLTKLDYQTGLS